MKTKNNIKAVLTVIVFLLAFITVKSQEEQIFEKEIKVSEGTTVSIDHKFGNIECTTWDKDLVSVRVEVSGDFDDRNGIKDKIHIEFEASSNKIHLETDFNSNNYNQKSLQIDYILSLPAYLNLKLENKFGSIYLETVTGTAEIENKFGNVKIGTLAGQKNTIEMKFGSIELDDFQGGTIDVQNGDTDIRTAGELNLKAKFGEVELRKVKHANIEVKNGSLTIDKVENLQYEGAFGGVSIGKVTGDLVLDNSHGNSKINQIAKNSGNITIDNKFGKVKLGINNGSSYKLHCEIKMGTFYYPEDLVSFTDTETSMTNKEYTGTLGKGNDDNSMEIESKNGDVVIFIY
ncbi:MAG: DUF4097 family beta strand repeat-containing protein [Bacteroidales bacterium]|nr:DUF4097 family beta strand repeat-containing protein [Bacteroidales bacterium]MCF8337486.1 DUF4097 family beta strand repeat-containing protein [Bacteroidales bacterium]